jgi:hypothetical protein
MIMVIAGKSGALHALHTSFAPASSCVFRKRAEVGNITLGICGGFQPAAES